MRLSYLSLALWRMVAAGVLLSITASLIGCATSPATPTPTPAQTAGITGGLLVVRLERVKAPPPESIVLEVGSATKSGKLQFTGRRSQNTSGEYSDYLVALPLPPDQYLLTGLNSSGGISDSSNFVFKAPFTVSASAPDYLGRLVLSTDLATAQTHLRVEDHYQEDTALFLSLLSKLKDLPIGNALIQASPMILRPAESPQQNTPPAASTAKSGNLIKLTPLTSDTASLLVPNDRAAFKKFLQLPFPRAFVTNHAGAQAMANGPTAAETALSRCNSRKRDKECQLFAINDMVVMPDKCAPPSSKTTARHTVSPDCPPTDNKVDTTGKTTSGNAPQTLSGTPAAALPPADASQTLKTNPGLEQLLRAGGKK